MSRTATDTVYDYLDCPVCGQGIAEPFALTSGPIAFVHGHGRSRCRLIVWPDPEGDVHRVWRVPPGQSLEIALANAITAARRGGWILTRRIGHNLATVA